MPELPEVQLVVDGLNRLIKDRVITHAEVFWPGYVTGVKSSDLEKIVAGVRFDKAIRRGKFIVILFDQVALLLHLRMTGKVVYLDEADKKPPHTHVLFTLDNGKYLAFADTRKFGRLEVISADAVEERLSKLNLGYEPFSAQFNQENISRSLKKRTKNIKNILLDQTIIAGIGNIYASEILFEAGLSPLRPGGSIKPQEIDRLLVCTRKVLKLALDNGGSSISDYIHPDGIGGEMQDHFKVYGRDKEPCLTCANPVKRIAQTGRSTFWCSHCQG